VCEVNELGPGLKPHHILKEISETNGVVNTKNHFQNHTENYIKPKKIRIKLEPKFLS
jgi:hypothetical protein